MTTLTTVRTPADAGPHKTADFVRLADILRDEAACELIDAFHGVSGKKIDAATFPGGISRTAISRACNGDGSNPLYRMAAMFLLMKRLGLSRKRAKGMVRWLDQLIDQIWPPEEDEDGDEPHDPKAALEAIRIQQEQLPRIVGALRRLVAAEAIR